MQFRLFASNVNMAMRHHGKVVVVLGFKGNLIVLIAPQLFDVHCTKGAKQYLSEAKGLH